MKHTYAIGNDAINDPIAAPLTFRFVTIRLVLAVCLGLTLRPGSGTAAGSEVRLGWTNTPGGVEVSWISKSLSPATPFVHYEFQVQHSSNLITWDNAALIPGGFLGSASVRRTFTLPATNAQGFIRLSYRLNMPGADLSGLDLSGADLRGANLAGANLSGTKLDGALLGGADLGGAIVAGATFAGANLQDVSLDSFDWTGLDLSQIRGTPRLTQLNADPLGDAAALLPKLPYFPNPGDFVANDPDVPGIVSRQNAMIMLKLGTTVAQLNSLLSRHGASIVASSPKDALIENGLLMVRFATPSALALYNLTTTLRTSEAIVATAAPDILIGPDIVPSDLNGASEPGSNWKWNNGLFGATGGNWGLERARVPQMWNLNDAVDKAARGGVPTCIIDNFFAAHDDIVFHQLLNATNLTTTPNQPFHGNHVAGIAGANYGNRNISSNNIGIGIDGVNPFAELTAYTHAVMPGDGSSVLWLDGTHMAGGYRIVEDVRDVLNNLPDVKVINLSLGFNWTKNKYVTTTPTAPELQRMEEIAFAYSVPVIALTVPVSEQTLLVCSAGNDGSLVPARLNSPMNYAALVGGVPNILVVESHGHLGARSTTSSIGGHVAAPGEDILSASNTNRQYLVASGTSMASPFVAGLAGYLLAVDPSLTPATLINLIQRNGRNVDAFTSLMEIDTLAGKDKELLRMLLDIDDGTAKGSTRILIPAPALGHDRSFEPVQVGTVYTNDTKGDGQINMADFRRWRDWFLFGDGNHSLNGGDDHIKHDANGDGRVDRSEEANLFPRGDFNGDGKSQRDQRSVVPGILAGQSCTDLEVLMRSGLWTDHEYRVDQLPDLIDSVDVTVSAKNFLDKNRDYAIPEGVVHIYDAESREPISFGGPVPLTAEDSFHLFTVPTGGKYYAASEPISIGGGTNVLMRSAGDLEARHGDRGADYAVDLTVVEMTAVAEVENPPLREIDSQPNEKEVDAYIPAGAGGQDTESVGARAWANDEGTFYALARAGRTDVPPPDPTQGTTFAATLQWQRSLIKDKTQRDPTFEVKPLVLRLVGSGPNGTELDALAEIVIEMRAYGVSPEWQPVFSYYAQISGKAALNGSPATFRIVAQEGDLPPKTLTLLGELGAEYVQEKHKGTINLDDVQDGHSFEMRYRLLAVVVGHGGDNEAFAHVGDPLDYGSGLRMNYGDFGDLPVIKSVSPAAPAGEVGLFQAAAQPPVLIEYFSKTNFYYRLYRGADADTTTLPFVMKLGIAGDDSMIDPDPLLANPTEDDYTLENQPINQPLDFDGDGIDDVYELRRPGILNPLNAADAFFDPDGDNRSNLEEYQQGTDPQTPDSPPANPTLNLPGLLVPTYDGGALIDINNDGLPDSAGRGLTVSRALLGGSFDVPVTSPLAGIRVVADTAYVKLDGDVFPDAVVIDFLTNRVFTFRGVGDGTFTPLTNHPAINSPNLIALCNLNGDALKDIAIFSQNGRGVDLHLNNGDGTLTRLATVTTNAYGSGNSFAMADLNNDSRDDIIVGYAFNVVVFLTQPNGAYGPAQAYPVGSFPSSVAVGDLNDDGRLDLVAVNASTDDLSVLVASAPGVFLPQVRYPVGDNPRQVQLARLRANGPLDAVITLASANYLVILPGLGNGTFGSGYTAASGTSLAAIHDWNNDGKLDLVSTISSSGGLIILGNGDGTFDTRLQIVPTNNPPAFVNAVDLNGDGKLELVGLQTQLNSVDVWEHAAVTGTNRLLTSLAAGTRITGYAPGDFNGDGRIDLAVTTQTNSFGARGSNQVVILINAGNFVFEDAGHYPFDWNANSVVAADFDGDGDLDLVVNLGGGTLVGGSRLVSLRNNGAGVFQTGAPTVVGNGLSAMLPVNAEADARVELFLRGSRLVGNTSVNFLEVYALDANDGWTNRQTLVATDFVSSQQMVLMNGDAYPDLVVLQQAATGPGGSLRLYPGGPAGFGPVQVLEAETEFSSFSRFADLNNDGLLDVTSFNTIYLAKAGGGFHPAQSIYVGLGGIQAVADFNRDGKADLLNGLSVLLQK